MRRLPVSAWAAVAWLVGLVGLWLRLQDFGRYGFWNDEAWVALSTRVAGPGQFWLALGPTPVGWASILQLFSWLPVSPEMALRLLPLFFSLLTLWAAWATASALAGGLAGVLAVAMLAFEPTAVVYGKLLKSYSAEAFVALLALLATIRLAESGQIRDLVVLALVLALGVLLSNAQLFLAPPLLAASLVVALWRRESALARRVAMAAVIVGTWDALLFVVFIRPRMLSTLVEYWAGNYVPTDGVGRAALFVGQSLVTLAGPAGTTLTLTVAAGGLVALVALVPRARVAVLGLGLLLAELAALSALRRLPLNEPRVMLFFSTLLFVVGAAGVGLLLARLASSPRFVPPVAAGVLLLLWHLTALPGAWTWRGRVTVEDVGPLIRFVEATRAPEDRLLVYQRSRYVYAYYQTATPVLVPDASTTVGFVPLLPDSRVLAIDAATAPAVIDRALAESRKVWFVGSRFRPGDAQAIITPLAARGEVVVKQTRLNGILMAVRRTGG